jgi:hypothetical protein
MRKVLLASTALVALILPAKADLMFVDQVNFHAAGFGNLPRLITMHTPTSGDIETGTVAPGSGQAPVVITGDAVAGANKSNTPTLGALNWTSGGVVELAFDVSQTGHTGLSLNTMGITIYNGTTAVATFQLPSTGYNITPTQADNDHGNGSGALVFSLTAAEIPAFNAVVAMNGSAYFTVGSFGSWGSPCPSLSPCMAANGGQDSLIAVTNVAVPGPIVGAGIPGLIAGALGLVGLARRRRAKAHA